MVPDRAQKGRSQQQRQRARFRNRRNAARDRGGLSPFESGGERIAVRAELGIKDEGPAGIDGQGLVAYAACRGHGQHSGLHHRGAGNVVRPIRIKLPPLTVSPPMVLATSKAHRPDPVFVSEPLPRFT